MTAPGSSPSPRTSFLRRLAAIVPPPRAHLTGYHGVFAARSRLRQAVAPKPKEPAGSMSPSPSPKENDRTNRTPWARLLKRVFLIDLLTCDKCGGRREVRAFVSSPALARKALEALGVPFEPLKIAKGHDPPSQESLDFGPGFDGVDGIDPSYPD
jgi:hypothetical protein